MKREIIWLSILATGALVCFAAVQGMLYLAKMPEFWSWLTGVSLFLNLFCIRVVFHYRNRVQELSDLLGSQIRLKHERNSVNIERLMPPEPDPEPELHHTKFLPDEFPAGDPEISAKEFNKRQAIGYRSPSPTLPKSNFLHKNGPHSQRISWSRVNRGGRK